MRTVVVLGCGKAKLDRAAPARELYTGSLFRAGLRFAESLTPDRIFVASARYGIVALDAELEPYDDTLTAHSKGERLAWGHRAAEHLRIEYPTGIVRLILLAGKEYAEPIEFGLRWYGGVRQTRWTVEMPLRGLGVGKRLQFLARAEAA